jgi:putative DNA methylase
MVWDYAETNPFAGAGGDILGIVQGTANAIEKLPAIRKGVVRQLDAASQLIAERSTILSTDPPYYDNISYADLSDFSYVWLRPMLKSIFPNEFSTLLVPKGTELVAASYRFNGNKDLANDHFETGIMEAFAHINPPDFPLTVYYAFRQSEIIAEEGIASTGWETMLNGLIETGFSVVGTWPVRTEGAGRLVAASTNALASSIVLVCRPRPEDAPLTSRREFVNSLRRELPAALRDMQSGNIAPVDLAQASIGPGMAVYSRPLPPGVGSGWRPSHRPRRLAAHQSSPG